MATTFNRLNNGSYGDEAHGTRGELGGRDRELHGSGSAVCNRQRPTHDATSGTSSHTHDARTSLCLEMFTQNNTTKHSAPVSDDRSALIDSFNRELNHVTDPTWHTYLAFNKDQFAQDVVSFAKDAPKHHLTEDKIAATFQQIQRLLNDEPNAAVNKSNRVRLAFEAMHHAAQPTEISQGAYRTCNVTTVEVQTMYRNPAEIVKVIADEAIKGVYTAPDGKRVELDHQSLVPTGQANNSIQDGERSYATQIANVALVNLAHIEQQSTLRYEQHEGDAGHNGERLVDTRTQRVVKHAPGLNDAQIARIDALLNGGKAQEYIAASSEAGSAADGTHRIASEEALEKLLTDRKQHNNFPLTIRVNCSSPLFVEDAQHAFNADSAWHVVNIVDYDPQTKRVSLDNQWSSNEDHIGEHAIPLSSVFESMRKPETAMVDYHARALVLYALNRRDFSLELKAWQRSLSLGTPEWVVLPAVKQVIADAIKRGRGSEIASILDAVTIELSETAQAEVNKLVETSRTTKH